tara:strand:- start:1778 stop:2209 length:432 start_codon:yes stop_codon:yes gene_type:complete
MRLWKWWFTFNAGILALAFGQYQFNLLQLLYEADTTMLTFFILAITLAASTALGLNRNDLQGKENSMYWFTSDAVLSLGMVGTLFGFLLVLGSAFTEIDTSSTESMTAAIGLLASGMSTALTTSLVGLVSSLWLKLQLVILEG